MIAETANLASGLGVVKEGPDVHAGSKPNQFLAWDFQSG
jgi:hypothetical protein